MDKVRYDSPSVQNYLTILQEVIKRMASNSASSKTWCIALVSAILVVIADRGVIDLTWIALFPIMIFLLLDAYYLGFERRFCNLYNEFVKKLSHDSAEIEDLFVLTLNSGALPTTKATLSALTSFSVWPFYTVQIFVLIVVRILLDP